MNQILERDRIILNSSQLENYEIQLKEMPFGDTDLGKNIINIVKGNIEDISLLKFISTFAPIFPAIIKSLSISLHWQMGCSSDCHIMDYSNTFDSLEHAIINTCSTVAPNTYALFLFFSDDEMILDIIAIPSNSFSTFFSEGKINNNALKIYLNELTKKLSKGN